MPDETPAHTPPTQARTGGAFWRLLGSAAAVNLGDGLMTVALVWLASSLTRDPFVLSLIAFASKLPWLVFSLPAGVIVDRVERRNLVGAMDAVRAVTMAVLTVVVLSVAHELPTPEQLAGGAPEPSSAAWVIVVLILVSLILGLCEVLRDNAAQTMLPSIVPSTALENANGRLWSAEMITNCFVGPPLAGALVGISFSLAFGLYTVLLAVGAVLVFTIPRTHNQKSATNPSRDAAPPEPPPLLAGFSVAEAVPVGQEEQTVPKTTEDAAGEGNLTAQTLGELVGKQSMWRAIKEGLVWLWNNRLLRTLAILLGAMNFSGGMTGTILVLYVQDVLGIFNGLWFGLVTTGVALGAVFTSLVISKITDRYPPGAVLKAAVVVFGATSLVQGLIANAFVFWATGLLAGVALIVWNVITVSLRQRIIPDAMLGRVNSVYRFFGWGSISLGTLAGGGLAALLNGLVGQEWALRWVFLAEGIGGLLCFVVVMIFVSTPKIRAAEGAAETPDSSSV